MANVKTKIRLIKWNKKFIQKFFLLIKKYMIASLSYDSVIPLIALRQSNVAIGKVLDGVRNCSMIFFQSSRESSCVCFLRSSTSIDFSKFSNSKR